MSGWAYECPCGWSVRAMHHASLMEAHGAHRSVHDKDIEAMWAMVDAQHEQEVGL